MLLRQGVSRSEVPCAGAKVVGAEEDGEGRAHERDGRSSPDSRWLDEPDKPFAHTTDRVDVVLASLSPDRLPLPPHVPNDDLEENMGVDSIPEESIVCKQDCVFFVCVFLV